ncbi:MAG: response regulator [Solirubrobacteraceae bacterium]
MSLDPELLEIFRQETEERLDRMIDTLLAVEAGTAADDAIDQLFRDAHSIKGNAGMVGFDVASKVAGALEDILERARAADALDPALTAPLLRAADAIRASAVDGQDGPAASAMTELAALETVASAEPPAADEEPAEPVADAPAAAPAPTASAAAPTRTLRVAADRVDRLLDAVGETVLHRRRLEHLLGPSVLEADQRLREEIDRGDVLLEDLQDAVVRMRTLPLASIVGAFPRAVRDIASTAGREVRLELSGVETQLDRVILDGISETIVHLLRNAVSHGIEPPDERLAAGKPREGTIELSAQGRGDRVAVTVADDGRGVPAALIAQAEREGSLVDVLARAGFSTAEKVDELSGRGVGLDAVKRHVESLGGALDVWSRPGEGTAVTLLLPLTLSLLHLLLFERGGQTFGLPLASVLEAVTAHDVSSLGGRGSIELRGESVGLSDLAAVVGAAAPALPESPPAVVVASSTQRVALMVDAVTGEQETVVKPLGAMLSGVPGYLGAAILADGRAALVLDPSYVARAGATRRGAPAVATPAVAPATEPPRLLVVDDQFTVRELQRSILESAGYPVETAKDGQEALERLRRGGIDLVLSDLEMPIMNGLELLAAVRAEAELGSLPFVIVTSRGSEEDRQRGAEAGADAYVVKGEFDQQALLDTVRRLAVLR